MNTRSSTIAPADALVERFVPDRNFPSCTHIPGRTPRPPRDAASHFFDRFSEDAASLHSDRWRSLRPYLWGIDLFNAGYYWEAHETWEGLWIAAGRRGATAEFFQGLIKLAAAGVKLREGNLRGAQRHLRRAAELLGAVAARLGPDASCFGLDCHALQAVCLKALDAPLPAGLLPTGAPVRVFPFVLRPR